MNLLALATLVITGFVSGAEFGSYAFVHPVLRRLPVTERITVEQGLLKTFGRVMPIGMTLCVVTVTVTATAVDAGGTAPLAWPAAAAFTAAVLFTVVVNVPINRATGRWDAQHPPADWEPTRNRWELFQGVRSWLLLLGFVLVCAASAA